MGTETAHERGGRHCRLAQHDSVGRRHSWRTGSDAGQECLARDYARPVSLVVEAPENEDADSPGRRPRPPRLICPPFRPANRASSDVHSCAVPFRCAARPPLLAISRCFSGDIDANPRRSLRRTGCSPPIASAPLPAVRMSSFTKHLRHWMFFGNLYPGRVSVACTGTQPDPWPSARDRPSREPYSLTRTPSGPAHDQTGSSLLNSQFNKHAMQGREPCAPPKRGLSGDRPGRTCRNRSFARTATVRRRTPCKKGRRDSLRQPARIPTLSVHHRTAKWRCARTSRILET